MIPTEDAVSMHHKNISGEKWEGGAASASTRLHQNGDDFQVFS